MAFGTIYDVTYWGDSVCGNNNGWGDIYRSIACNVTSDNLIAENGDNLIDEIGNNLISN